MNYSGPKLGEAATCGPIAKSTSLAEQSHMLLLHNEAALKFLNQIMSRLDNIGIKESPDDGSRPSMTILQQLETATQIVGRMNETLGQLERKIFG